MTDPAAMEGMMGMMKGNMAMMIPQTLIMSWINAFFAGFVISLSPILIQGSSWNPLCIIAYMTREVWVVSY